MGKLTAEQIDDYCMLENGYMPDRRTKFWQEMGEKAEALARHLQYQPEPVSGDLVEKCLQILLNTHGEGTLVASNMYDRQSMLRRMSAIIRVVLDEALKEPDKAELAEMYRGETSCGEGLIRVIATRRARLLRPKSPEERVKVETVPHSSDRWYVLFDGIHAADSYFHSKKDAETYRLGLIAKLKEEGSNA